MVLIGFVFPFLQNGWLIFYGSGQVFSCLVLVRLAGFWLVWSPMVLVGFASDISEFSVISVYFY
jgi:hypothetical protein